MNSLKMVVFVFLATPGFAFADDVIIPLGRVPGSMMSDNRADNGLPQFPPKKMPRDLRRCTKFVRDNSLYLRCPSDS